MASLYSYERSLAKVGLGPVAGADEAGRGACAGPLVVGAAVLGAGRSAQVPGLNDSKLLTPAARERVYAQIVKRALAWSVVVIPAAEVDRIGLHVANLQGMRRAVAALSVRPSYVLTDGFPVAGIGSPGLAVWKGDQVAACIAAASVVAKVTRDRIMVEMHEQFPIYGFAGHKGYITREHQAALAGNGPCPQHRRSFINVRSLDGRSIDLTELGPLPLPPQNYRAADDAEISDDDLMTEMRTAGLDTLAGFDSLAESS